MITDINLNNIYLKKTKNWLLIWDMVNCLLHKYKLLFSKVAKSTCHYQLSITMQKYYSESIMKNPVKKISTVISASKQHLQGCACRECQTTNSKD